MSCSCGNFFGYKTPEDVPDHDVDCEMCDRKVLEYIGKDDQDLVYMGIDIETFNKKVYEVKDRLGL